MQEEKISKITEMLLAGGKMLGVHCGSCMSPLFQYQGKVVCPVCGDKAKPAKEEAKAAPLRRVEEVLYAKLNSLAEQLAKETDHTKTLELLNSIKSTLEALEKLKEG
ncbi:MAG: Sjogren's syndrome/scleroderma autoantigen 1 family protein [Hadesarchaea archaeon]|nr:Sjogren's syndrome/scleroderma autoantigen 1 family protein [Hadesarchaea archaeon]